MIQVAPGTKVHLACRPVSMRYGFDGLCAKVASVLALDPFSGHLFCFRSKRGDYLKILYWDGSGLCLFAKRLERGRFVWPPIVDGALVLTPAQLALLLEAIDWRRTVSLDTSGNPFEFMFTESINILAMVILGGVGNLFGVILGAVLIVSLPEVFREFDRSSTVSVRN
jgi:transposase